MKLSLVSALAGSAAAHTIFQKVSVNGVEQGQLKGVRAPSSNYPIQNVNDAGMACNKNIQYTDSTIITVPAGAKVGAWWGHVIGGPQGGNDAEHPIATSHKGPIQYYLAKVDNAASASTSGQKWFKVAHDGLSGGKWAVDTMYAAGGWHYFTMPTCIAPGDYLMRVELLALHSASSSGGAQFYMGCAQIRVTGSGTTVGSNTVSFPGAYQASHPGITVSIYDAKGSPYPSSYSIPGPAPITCSGGSSGGGGNSNNGGGSSPQPSTGEGAALYGQCGGSAWTGPTTCKEGTCKANGEHYSQCVP
ncbi:family 61 glycosyl hydrolase [Phaeosphaeria sp. MPI-PUGE-AT-0046c]|nr:family 61 glycosyl hydrolase [Phaeosphaeria sp. MPI-PUGE-AT-0046c]